MGRRGPGAVLCVGFECDRAATEHDVDELMPRLNHRPALARDNGLSAIRAERQPTAISPAAKITASPPRMTRCSRTST